MALLVAGLWFAYRQLADRQLATYVEIAQDGTISGVYPLRLDRVIQLNSKVGRTIIQIKAGRVRISESPGQYQYCVKQGWLSRAGAVAICLPSKISIRLTGNAATEDTLAY